MLFRSWAGPAASSVETLLIVDAELFGTDHIMPQRPKIEFGDSIQEQPRVLAETADVLGRAVAASTATRVRTAHPDWNNDQVQEEVILIRQEQGAPADPTTIGPVDVIGDTAADDGTSDGPADQQPATT